MKHIISLAVLGLMVSTSTFVEARGHFKHIKALASVFCEEGGALKIPKCTQKRFEESNVEGLAINTLNQDGIAAISDNEHLLSASNYLGVISSTEDGATFLSVFDKKGNMITEAPIIVPKESEQIPEELHSLMVIPQESESIYEGLYKEPETLFEEFYNLMVMLQGPRLSSCKNNSEADAYKPCSLMDVMHFIAFGTVAIVSAIVVAGGAGVLLLCCYAAAGAGAFMAVYAFGVGLCIPFAVGSYILDKIDNRFA